MNPDELENIKSIAIQEVQLEIKRAAIEKYKKKLREHKTFWDWLFPYKIIFIRKENPWR